MKHFNTKHRTMLLLLMVLLTSLSTFAQSSMVGDGFGGRPGYNPVNYYLSWYTGYAICGANRQLTGWGGNGLKQISSSTTTTLPVTSITGMTNVRQIAGNTGPTTIIKDDGTGWIIGTSNCFNFPSPTQLITNAYYSATSGCHNVFVKNDGTVWTSGTNTFGVYGNGTTTSSCTGPAPCSVQMQGITNAKRVATDANSFYTIILLADGTVKQVGTGTGVPASLSSTTPVTVPGLSNVVDIRAAYTGAFALTASGQVYSWMALPLNSGTGVATTLPTLITFPSGAAPIKAISMTTRDGGFALDDNGNLYAWGRNYFGEIGIGTSADQPTPVLVATNVQDIKAGRENSYMFKTDGTMWVTGNNSTIPQLWMNLSSTLRYSFTQVNPLAVGLCAPTAFNGMPPCAAGTTAPAVTPTTATNSCPTTTVNLGSLAVSSTTPSGASLIWSTNKVPTSAADTLTTAQKAAVSTAGKYYALYYDATNACYSPADSVEVTITGCAINLANTCPTATVNLMTAISATNLPSGATVTWHTGTPATTANKVTDPTAVSTSGTYYLAFFDATNNCYSDVSQVVTVTITTCVTPLTVSNPPAQTATTGAAKTGNAATELSPTGGTAPYVYSNGASDPACVAPSGATALTGLTVNNDGTYSYTAPTMAGTYYYCIKVCDSATPTASCVVKTYTLTVSAPVCTVNGVTPTFIKN